MIRLQSSVLSAIHNVYYTVPQYEHVPRLFMKYYRRIADNTATTAPFASDAAQNA